MARASGGRAWGAWRTAVTLVLVAAVGVTASVWRTETAGADPRYLASTTVRPQQPATLHAGPVTVDVPAGAVDRPARLSIGPPVEVDVDVAPGVVAGPAHAIHLDGAALRTPLTVTMRLPDGVGPDSQPWLGHRRFDGTWTAEPATADRAAGVVTAEVGDLSLFSVQWLDLGALRDRLGELFTSTLQGTSDLLMYGSADGPGQPLCPLQDEAARRGIAVEVSGEPVPACVGMSGERARVQLVNTRPYPVLLQFPTEVELRRRGSSHADITGLLEMVLVEVPVPRGSRATVLRAGESADLVLDAGAGPVALHLEPSGAAMLAAVLNSAVTMLAQVYLGMARTGLVRLPTGLDDPVALASAWELTQCGPRIAEAAARDDVLAALSGVLRDLLGCVAGVAAEAMSGSIVGLFSGVVSAAVSLVVPLAQQLVGSVLALVDYARGADSSTVTVRRTSAGGGETARAVDSPVVLFLVDVSSSMAEDDGTGTVRIDGARRAIHAALADAPPGALFGLRTYPSAGGCDPGALRYGWVNGTDDGLHEAVEQLTTGGNTPTGPALRSAADQLLALELSQPATIVLVSDGESNCGPDPCVVAEEVAADGLAIVHTVGFEISEAGRAELDCVSSATGGTYLDAGDSAALARQLGHAASPRLELALDSVPERPVPAGGLVTVGAAVQNPSPQRVDDVRLQLSFPPAAAAAAAELSPLVAGPVRSVGNLAPGERRRVEWQYRAPVAAGLDRHDFTITASARNASAVRADGTVTYTGELSLAAAGPLLRDADHVVIMGDSYSSGEGAGDYHPETAAPEGNMCHRSDRTYAMTLDWPREPQLLACSGATTRDLTGFLPRPDEPHQGEPPQLDQLRDLADPPDLVMLTIGGNNIGFSEIVGACVRHGSCHDRVTYPNPELSDDCLRRYTRDLPLVDFAEIRDAGSWPPEVEGCPPYRARYADTVFARIEAEAESFRQTYAAIDSVVNSPAARQERDGRPAHVVVLAYPALTPQPGQERGSCVLGLSAAELRFGAEVADLLNQQVGEVVAELREQGRPVYFAADVAGAFQPDHTVCSRDPHVVPVSAGRIAHGVLGGDGAVSGALRNALCVRTTLGLSACPPADPNRYPEQLHPTADGYLAMTAALLRWSHRPEAVPLTDVDAAPPSSNYRIPLGDRPIRLGPSPDAIVGTWPAGVAVQLQGTGFEPGTRVHIGLQSAPIGVGTALAAGDGSVDTVIPLPAGLPPGLHTVTATGVDPYGHSLQRYALVEVRRPDRPWRAMLWGVAAALLVAAAAGAWLGRRTAAGP